MPECKWRQNPSIIATARVAFTSDEEFGYAVRVIDEKTGEMLELWPESEVQREDVSRFVRRVLHKRAMK